MIAIIGAGPAGIQAAITLTRGGKNVTLIDAAPYLGGQFWRNSGKVRAYRAEEAEKLMEELKKSPKFDWCNNSQVWNIEEDKTGFHIHYLRAGVEETLHARSLILATGAYDRALAFEGWDIPGSITPGAAQAMLKSYGTKVGRKIVVAGTGPFLLPVATGLARSGVEVVAICEANSPLLWAKSLPALILNFEKVRELRFFRSELKKFQIPYIFNAVVSSFNGKHAVISHVTRNFEHKKVIADHEVDVVAVGWGFTTDVSLAGALGCEMRIERDGNVVVQSDPNQRSSNSKIWVCGEITGVGGADLAQVEGHIAALSVLQERIPASLKVRRWRKKIFAQALLRSYPVQSGWTTWPQRATTLCRCEEVKRCDIDDAMGELGAHTSRGAKLFTRSGMGLCQGRVCTRMVSEYVAVKSGIPPSVRDYIAAAQRPIAAPISLGELSSADGDV